MQIFILNIISKITLSSLPSAVVEREMREKDRFYKTVFFPKTPFVLAFLLLLILFSMGCGNPKVSWYETYEEDSKQPYGTFLATELLKNYFPDEGLKIMTDSIQEYLSNKEETANYVFIGGEMFMDTASFERLIDFVERGNSAFIASKKIPINLVESVIREKCETFTWGDYYTISEKSADFDFFHTDLKFQDSVYNFTFEENFKKEFYRWGYFPEYSFCEDLEYFNQGSIADSLINFFQINHGDGAIYFHSNPILFTNHSLISEEGKEYANRVFAHLPTGKIYWDKRSRIEFHWDDENWWMNQKRTFDSEGPLKYVLAQPSLAWAWYILMAMALLYLLFRAKRQQRIIPVLEENRNTSLEFISTIGRMHFVQQNHRKIALEKIKLWKGFVRERYKISTKNLDEQFINQLANKSNFPKSEIERILRISKNIQDSGFLSENSLIDFHKLLERFYNNSKKG